MNVHEVVANLASLSPCGSLDAERRIHSNDDTTLGQFSNDVFQTAVHIAVARQSNLRLLPAPHDLRREDAFESFCFVFASALTCGGLMRMLRAAGYES